MDQTQPSNDHNLRRQLIYVRTRKYTPAGVRPPCCNVFSYLTTAYYFIVMYAATHLHPDLVIGLDSRRLTAARSRGDVHADDRGYEML